LGHQQLGSEKPGLILFHAELSANRIFIGAAATASLLVAQSGKSRGESGGRTLPQLNRRRSRPCVGRPIRYYAFAG